ncbi:organic hydroperoxide resistance protein [Mangrovicoccus ximenensis]|uniref:organic hydroperoxide resistance protein n=1 Tax=Mangrovicoccus ximenensis TaxID=1911570 RepID=UPI000D366C0B|nr:organic hydroperoxide resistance protein [Mangrovicoccus ximenensis]
MSLDFKYWTAGKATGGGRSGRAELANGALALDMAMPEELGGTGRGCNPEELFALGYGACYLSALRFAAQSEQLGTVPEEAAVTAHVGIGGRPEGGFALAVRLEVSMPGVDAQAARAIAERAHEVCPYSNAVRGNIDVEIVLA